MNKTPIQRSTFFQEGCDAAFDGILQPDLTTMTEEEKDEFNAGYLYMTQRALTHWCPEPV